MNFHPHPSRRLCDGRRTGVGTGIGYPKVLRWLWISVLFWFLVLVAIQARAQTAGQITLAVEVTTASNGTVTPKATWSTNPVATSCTAFSGWTGAKAASGSEALPAVSKSTVYGISCTWNSSQAVLSWGAPTKNTDGSQLTDLKGYQIFVTAPDAATSTLPVDGAGVVTYSYPMIKPGNYSFTIASVTASGVQSAQSNAVTVMSASGTAEKSVTLAVNIPLPPSNFTAH